MTHSAETRGSDSGPGIEDVLAEYLEKAEAGLNVEADALLERFPFYRAELQAFIAMDRRLREQRRQETSQNSITMLCGVAENRQSAPQESGFHPMVVGDYELLEEIDRGGMGVVFRARHKFLRRTAAIKMLLAGSFASDESERRFRREAAAAARLNHSGIVPVYDVGRVESSGGIPGRTWYAMALIEGTSLARRIADHLPGAIETARLGIQIADAIDYAHQQGVIHRDLKPANILLDRDGMPRIIDFGLSRCLEDDDTRLTAAGQIFGTPGYMSPEQAAGRNHDVGVASDVYSLGAVLYCLLTGRPPFRGHSTMVTLQQIINDLPVPPRLLSPEIPPDLESIVLKCLEKRPQDRYHSADELRLDLQRFLNGDAVTAASVNLIGYVGRVLGSSRNSEFLEGWSRALYQVAAVVLIAHLLMWACSATDTVITFLNIAKFAVLLGIVWRERHGVVTPQNPVERTIWNLWISYLMTWGAAEVVVRLHPPGSLNSFVLTCLSSGVILTVLGGQVWGGCYVLALLFLLLAPVLTCIPQYSPLLFGSLWSLSFCLLARRCRRRSEAARRAEQDRRASADGDTAEDSL